MMFKDRVSASRMGIALAAALLLLGVPTLSGAAPTQAECSNAWDDSAADDTCDNESISVSGEDCRVTASCLTEDPWFSLATDITTSLSNVDDLHNCSGSLNVGSCS